MGRYAVEIKNLRFAYKEQNEDALKGIDLSIEKNTFTVIMGPSGAGKTTLCFTLNGLIPKFEKGNYRGEVYVNGTKTTDNEVGEMSKHIGLVFQDFESQLFSTNVELEVAFAPENFGVPREEIKERIEESLRMVNLSGCEERAPSTLSGGQKQRLVIASVFSMKPEIICMDEPTTDLDPIGKDEVFSIAEKIREEKDITQIIVEHEMEEALVADRILLMDQGQIIKDGTPDEVLRDVDTSRSLGIMPLSVPDFFDRLGESYLPLTAEEGARHFREQEYAIDPERYETILAEERRKSTAYGDVIIDCRGLYHRYPNGLTAVSDIDLSIRKGEFVAVVGQNGSGKTTLVRHFNGLLAPTGGDLYVNGLDAKEHNVFDLGQIVGYVFQNPDHQIFENTVYEEVAFSPRIRNCSEEEVDQRVKHALKSVRLEGYEEEDPFSLTKGERQRVAVASVLSARPQVMIFDEPTTGLDYKEQKSMMELIKELNDTGHTIIIVTHSMWVVAEYAHRTVVMKNGENFIEGSTRQVFAQEEKLKDVSLKAPQIISMSNRLGNTALSVEEMLNVTTKKKIPQEV
jgi:energy-coupling factor transport system ATP-binding protein